MVDCIFCKIVKGEIPSYKIYVDREFLAFLDVFPATKGQTLILPKKHVPYLFDLDESSYVKLFSLTKEIGKAIDAALDPERTCVVVEGFQVPHVHVRLHPCYEQKLLLKPIDPRPSDAELEKILQKVKEKLRLL